MNVRVEYERLRAENAKMKEETLWLRNCNEEAKKENTVLNAQIEIVRLIFGGQN